MLDPSISSTHVTTLPLIHLCLLSLPKAQQRHMTLSAHINTPITHTTHLHCIIWVLGDPNGADICSVSQWLSSKLNCYVEEYINEENEINYHKTIYSAVYTYIQINIKHGTKQNSLAVYAYNSLTRKSRTKLQQHPSKDPYSNEAITSPW